MGFQLLIGGASASAANGATFERHDPVMGEVATRAASGGVEDAKRACDAAATAFPAWSALEPGARCKLLLKAAEAMKSRAGDFAALMTMETGATASWSGFNVHPTVADEAQIPFGGMKGYGRCSARRPSPSSRTCAG